MSGPPPLLCRSAEPGASSCSNMESCCMHARQLWDHRAASLCQDAPPHASMWQPHAVVGIRPLCVQRLMYLHAYVQVLWRRGLSRLWRFGGMGDEEETTPKGHDVHVELEVTLNDLYLGHQYKACLRCIHLEVHLDDRHSERCPLWMLKQGRALLCIQSIRAMLLCACCCTQTVSKADLTQASMTSR